MSWESWQRFKLARIFHIYQCIMGCMFNDPLPYTGRTRQVPMNTYLGIGRVGYTSPPRIYPGTDNTGHISIYIHLDSASTCTGFSSKTLHHMRTHPQCVINIGDRPGLSSTTLHHVRSHPQCAINTGQRRTRVLK